MTGLNEKKDREIIGLKIDHVESFEAWKGFFKDLKSRGLQSPKLVVSDAHAGLKKAIEREFIGTSWQRCTVHFKRNIIEKLPKKGMKQVIADMRRIYHSISIEEARSFKEEFITRYQNEAKLTRAIEILEDGFEDSIQYYNEPEMYQRLLSSTNALERLNQEIRRRERVIRIFPNTQSAFRLIGAVLMEYEKLQLSKRVRLG